MTIKLKDIPPLLHDARLIDCRWDSILKTLDLCFRCLRRDLDGTPIEDSTVDLKLGGVVRIVAHYSPSSVMVKPSEFVPNSRTTLADLEEWPHGAVEAHLAINSPQADFDAVTACIRDELMNDSESSHSNSPLRVHISFEPHNYGPQGTVMGLFIDCDTLEPFTNGVPLEIEIWEQQFEAWWAGWRGHWAAKGQDSEEIEPAMEDTFIPAGQPDTPDLSYRPPAAVPFQVAKTTTPPALLKPVEDYHTCFHQQDWLKVAESYPHFDFSLEDRATRLRDQYLGWDHGRWVYVRYIDKWWQEGERACVVVRGIEHIKSDDGSPAVNEETVLTYGLKRSQKGWVIASWSQGWPRFKSADKLLEPQSWRNEWNLTE